MRRVLLPFAFLLAGVASVPAAVPAQTVTLAQAADSALAHHPTVAAARAAVEAAEAGVRGARAAYLPHLAVSSQATRFEEPMVVAPLHGFDPAAPPHFDETLVQSRLGVEYTLFDGGGRAATTREALGRSGVADARLEDARAALLEATAAAYLGVVTTRAAHEAARLRRDALDAETLRARRAYEEGSTAYLELVRAQAALTEARADVTQAQSRAYRAEGDLARLAGVSREAVEAWVLHTDDPTAGEPEWPRADTTSSTPRLQAAERALDAAQARLGVQRATLLPSLEGTAGLVNYAAGDGTATTEWQAGVRLSWPVFTGGARRAGIQGAEAEVARAREELRLARLERTDAVEAALGDFTEAWTRLAAVNAAVDQWEEVARIEALRMENGAGVQSDLLLAQARLFQARVEAVRTRNAIVLARIRLARAEGTLTRDWLDTELEMEP